ncbi:338_t:CDS:1, partial [Cetraspora pellucida]
MNKAQSKKFKLNTIGEKTFNFTKPKSSKKGKQNAKQNNNNFISGTNELAINYAIESTVCWASQVNKTEFFETNQENINFLDQNEA